MALYLAMMIEMTTEKFHRGGLAEGGIMEWTATNGGP